jgi:hypothetical protein
LPILGAPKIAGDRKASLPASSDKKCYLYAA